MRFYCLLTLAAIAVSGSSCYRDAYYVSPLYGSSTPYHTIPVKNERVKSATYASANFQVGTANDEGADNTVSLQFNAYRTHQSGFFQMYYGGGLTTGIYDISAFDSSRYSEGPRYRPSYLNVIPINNHQGANFFGSGNIHGGINLSVPFSDRPRTTEWRIGTKMALHKEFGQYLSFRKTLNPDSVSGVANSSLLGSFSGTTELVFPAGSSGNFGGQMEVGWILGKQYRDMYFGKHYNKGARYSFVTFTLQFTKRPGTAYFQQTFGNRMYSFHAGYNYLLGSKKKKPR